MGRAGRLILAFGRFWWDFLIGDNPDAFIGAVAVIAVVLALRGDRVAGVVLAPAITIGVLALSTYRGRMRQRG